MRDWFHDHTNLTFFSLQIWCAAGLDVSGGRTKDGGHIVGASIFYHSPPESETQKSDDVSALDSELKSGAKNVKEAEKEQQNLSSLVILLFSKLFLFIYGVFSIF